MGAVRHVLLDRAPSAWPWWVGAAAALVAMGLLLGPVARWESQAERQLADASQAVSLATVVGKAAPPPVQRALLSLPEAARSPGRAVQLQQLARKHGLQVQRLREQWDGTGQLQLSLVGRGPYANWRAFVAAALLADPAVVLDRLHLQRPDGDAAELDAETQWTFLHKAAFEGPARQESPR